MKTGIWGHVCIDGCKQMWAPLLLSKPTGHKPASSRSSDATFMKPGAGLKYYNLCVLVPLK